MKVLSRIQMNPIHRDLIIATVTGFTMAVLIVMAVMVLIL